MEKPSSAENPRYNSTRAHARPLCERTSRCELSRFSSQDSLRDGMPSTSHIIQQQRQQRTTQQMGQQQPTQHQSNGAAATDGIRARPMSSFGSSGAWHEQTWCRCNGQCNGHRSHDDRASAATMDSSMPQCQHTADQNSGTSAQPTQPARSTAQHPQQQASQHPQPASLPARAGR